MAKLSGRSSRARFVAYVEKLTEVIGHADRARPLRDYCTGLLMRAERKSVEPMAAVTAPARVAAQHQSLLHFVANAPWSDGAMLRRGAGARFRRLHAQGAGAAWAGARDRLAGDPAHGAGRGLDHRRHGHSQEGAALGGSGAAVLRRARQ